MTIDRDRNNWQGQGQSCDPTTLLVPSQLVLFFVLTPPPNLSILEYRCHQIIFLLPRPRCWAPPAMKGWVSSFWKGSASPRRSPSSWEAMCRCLAWVFFSCLIGSYVVTWDLYQPFYQAKRYLVFKNPSYHDCLSEASKGTLVCQVNILLMFILLMMMIWWWW